MGGLGLALRVFFGLQLVAEFISRRRRSVALFFRQFGAFTFGETVAEGAEPAVKGNRAFTVIALEVPVMKIMKIRPRGEFAVQDWTLEAVMAPSRPQRSVL